MDALFQKAAQELAALQNVLREFQGAGGNFHHRPIKIVAARALLGPGFRPFLELPFVGTAAHCQPLAQQLGSLMPATDLENSPAAKSPWA